MGPLSVELNCPHFRWWGLIDHRADLPDRFGLGLSALSKMDFEWKGKVWSITGHMRIHCGTQQRPAYWLFVHVRIVGLRSANDRSKGRPTQLTTKARTEAASRGAGENKRNSVDGRKIGAKARLRLSDHAHRKFFARYTLQTKGGKGKWTRTIDTNIRSVVVSDSALS
jgi:hypothetical protein